jgi:CheY-like chemotaxis protein
MNHILVIDDEKAVLEVIQQALMRFGFEVEVAQDGQEGIQKFDNGDFDLVLTDLRMPGIDGIGVLHHIRSSSRRLTPIIGFSGTPWLLKDSDFDLVFPKPFPLKDLVSAVQNLSTKSAPALPF